MKTILLHIHDDDAREAPTRVAIDLARLNKASIVCLQITARSAYVSGDMFGNIYAAPEILEAVSAYEAKLRDETHARMAGMDIDWTYEQIDGDPARTIVQRARLIDLVVLGRASESANRHDPLPLAGDVALHTRAPVLAVAPSDAVFLAHSAAVVAWDGGVEAANGLRAALPMLRHARAIHVVAVGKHEPDLPTSAAIEFLKRHGLLAKSQCGPHHDRHISDGYKVTQDGNSIASALIDSVEEFHAAYLVMGAYGHSRAREFLLGGVTRNLIDRCPVPLLLAH